MIAKIHTLYRGRSQQPIVRIIPDGVLYRIEWPDIGLSDLTNLTRAKAAALEWAQQKAVTEGRNLSVAQRLKSLDNFRWTSSPVVSAPNFDPALREAA
jgi:hypothetical protein